MKRIDILSIFSSCSLLRALLRKDSSAIHLTWIQGKVHKPRIPDQHNSGAERKQALLWSHTIQLPATTTQHFKTDDVLEQVFYVPVSEPQEEIDSFLLLDGILYILQFTVGQNYCIKPGFVGFL